MSYTTAPAAVGSTSGDRARLLPSPPSGVTLRQKSTGSRPASVAPIHNGAAPLRAAAA
jgi:hypothetical protein